VVEAVKSAALTDTLLYMCEENNNGNLLLQLVRGNGEDLSPESDAGSWRQHTKNGFPDDK